MELSDYEKQIINVKKIPKVYLGQEVETDIGNGIIVSLDMEFNGLYLSPESARCVVWFSTSDSKDGWVSKSFKLSELYINARKDKLEKIKELYGNMGS